VNKHVPVRLQAGSRRRLAFRFTPQTIRLHIPGLVIGSYLLLDHGHPVYIGRSDTCLRRRLESHPLLGMASHVAWEAASSPERAFLSEAFWYHELQRYHQVLNLVHPARPAGSDRNCPYCSGGPAERKALLLAFPGRPAPGGREIQKEPSPSDLGGVEKEKEGNCNG
jgi:hypothetical protein